MKNLSTEEIHKLLHKCLDGEYKVEGWKHPLGFGHIKIHTDNPLQKIRLHYWDKKMDENEIGEPDRIHNHSFDFTSYVLKGGLMEKFYTMTLNSFGEDNVWEIENKGDHSVLRKTSIKCNKISGNKIYHNQGEVYNMYAGLFHDTIATSDNTVTLVFETPRPDVSSLMICSQHISEIKRDKWPEINNDEITKIIKLVLN